MTIQEFQNKAKKEINRTMEGLMAMVEQIEVSASQKPKKESKSEKKLKAKVRLHSKF
jgi:hypothetical protein